MRIKVMAATMAVALSVCVTVLAQDAPPPNAGTGQGQGRGMGRGAFHGVAGQITAIEGSTITLQTFRGDTAKVKIIPSTRFMKDGNDAKLADFKVGERVFVGGDQDRDGAWVAQVLGQRTGMMGGMQVKPEDNGRTYIAGELIKIDGTKLTVKKPDNTEQVIEVDDDTSFRNERRESVTLADLKSGDFLRGIGAVKDGVFVAKALNAGGQRRMRPMAPPRGGASPAPSQPATDSNDEKK